MNVCNTPLDGVLKIVPEKPAVDHRGIYIETYNKRDYEQLGIDFVQDDVSVSSKNVLRGIHGDSKTYKLISCPYGKIYLVVVNYDKESPEFRKWTSFTLGTEDYFQILVPPKFGNGHLILTDYAVFSYKQSEYYDRSSQFTIRYDSPELGVYWPVSTPVLSYRDRTEI